jgi:hypothetical protein
MECLRHTAVVGVLAVTACGPGPDPVHGETSVDAGGAAPDSAHETPTPPLPPQGLITIFESRFVDAPAYSWVDAFFGAGPPLGTSIATDGPCTTYPLADPGTTKFAGEISITGTTAPVTLSPNGGVYGLTPPPDDLFTPHAPLHVAASGGPDFVAFAADLSAPADLVFTPPEAISRAGHTLTWNADPATVALVIVVADSSITPMSMICRVPDNGRFAIAASNLALLPPDATHVAVAIARTDEVVLATASGLVTIWATSEVGRDTVRLTP